MDTWGLERQALPLSECLDVEWMLGASVFCSQSVLRDCLLDLT